MATPPADDPSIYLYDEIYDDIKKQKKDSGSDRYRSRSRDKSHNTSSKRASKYIRKMKAAVEQREKDHERAHEKKIERENKELGIEDEHVYVTESYLKKQLVYLYQAKKDKEKEEYDKLHSAYGKDVYSFKRKLLDDHSKFK